jgi:hypothetical protein
MHAQSDGEETDVGDEFLFPAIPQKPQNDEDDPDFANIL